MARTQQPVVNYTSKGAIACNGLLINPANSVWFFVGAIAPVDGTSGDGAGWAGPGSIYISLASGAPKMYINGGAGTKLSPVWKLVTSA